MKKLLAFLLFTFTAHLCAQNYKQWEDPYLKPNAPGSEELQKASNCFYQGDIKNYLIALDCAGKKGNLLALFNLGIDYLNGIDGYLIKDSTQALNYFSYAAQQGYAPAQAMTAILYFEETGSMRKMKTELGLDYLRKSAEQGYLPGKAQLANLYLVGKNGVVRDEEKGLKLTEECANAGDVKSQYVLGVYYLGASGREPDYGNAVKWLSVAADHGDWRAFAYLANIYAKGNGVEKDYHKAHKLINDGKFQAQQFGQLTKDVEASLLSSEGEIFLMEGKHDEADAIWNKLKDMFPEYVELNKYEVDNIFIRKMYARDHDENELSLASNREGMIVSDVDQQIPENDVLATPTFAVIIANENYKEIDNVPFAVHDGEVFMHYCEKTLGIPQSNIKFVADATLNNIKRQLSWLSQVMDVYQGEANIIFYYAGHGIPDEKDKSAYLLPVDGFGSDVSTGYSLDKLYTELGSKPAKSVVVLLDACFSGSKRDGGMLAAARGVAIKAKQNAPKGNMVVISAAQGDETAYPYKEKGHGMFTYYLLKMLQETKGDVTYGELADYVTSEVKKQSLVTNGKMQTPTATAAGDAVDWRSWKLR